MVYLRKGEKAQVRDIHKDYIPFSDSEFNNAKDLLEKNSRFKKLGDGWYASNKLQIQFSDGVNKQVDVNDNSGDYNDPIIKELINILHPEYYLDAKCKKHKLIELLD